MLTTLAQANTPSKRDNPRGVQAAEPRIRMGTPKNSGATELRPQMHPDPNAGRADPVKKKKHIRQLPPQTLSVYYALWKALGPWEA